MVIGWLQALYIYNSYKCYRCTGPRASKGPVSIHIWESWAMIKGKNHVTAFDFHYYFGVRRNMKMGCKTYWTPFGLLYKICWFLCLSKDLNWALVCKTALEQVGALVIVEIWVSYPWNWSFGHKCLLNVNEKLG